MDQALSSSDINNFFDDKIKILTYDQLKKYKSVDELLKPYGRVVILYFWEDEPKRGHWITCFGTKHNTIEFFDSLATKSGKPDMFLKDIPNQFKQSNGEDNPYLSKLLYECPEQIEYNDMKIQGDTSSTCGRHVILRLCCSDIPIETYQKLFTKNTKKNDELSVRLIN